MKKHLPFFPLLLSLFLFASCDKSEDLAAPATDPSTAPAPGQEENPTSPANPVTTTALLLRLNQDSNLHEIQEVNLSDGTLKLVGTSPEDPMSMGYDLNQINYDEKNNQLVGLYQDKRVWVFNLATKTHQVLDLPGVAWDDSYLDLVTTKDKTLVLKWNHSNFTTELHEVNLGNGSLTLVGASSAGVMTSNLNLDQLKYDEKNNRVLALHEDKGIWIFDLGTKTDKVVALPVLSDKDDQYQDILLTPTKNYVIRWNDANTASEVHEVDLSTGSLKLLGASGKYKLLSSYNLPEVSYDEKSHRILGMVGSSYIWTFDLTKNTDGRIIFPIEMGTRYSFKDLLITNKR